MRTTTILLSVFLLMTSCLSRKTTQKMAEVSSASEKEKVFNVAQWLYKSQEHDSNHMVWHFQTDAPFSYHPDTGLRAQHGNLTLSMQSDRQRSIIIDSNDKAAYITDHKQWHEDRKTISERRLNHNKIGWWIAGILLVIGGVYLFWK